MAIISTIVKLSAVAAVAASFCLHDLAREEMTSVGHLKTNTSRVWRAYSRSSSSFLFDASSTPGIIVLRTDEICPGLCRATVVANCIVVRWFSRPSLPEPVFKPGKIVSETNSSNSGCGAVGKNCARVQIARLRTAGRE